MADPTPVDSPSLPQALRLSGEAPIECKRAFSLTEEEHQLFDFLKDALREWIVQHPADEGLQLRVAGGWVRDKILGREAHDIDIALEHGVSPSEFAQHAEDVMGRRGFTAHHVASIAIRPELFKHLETATAKLFEFHVDFCNLRSDDYATGSSASDVRRCGTPEEDALQRDLTVNSLFYNINSDKIEDFTRKGLGDLKSRLLRTPITAERTLRDDPLRALRAIRLSGKLKFSLDPSLLQGFRDQVVLDSLKSKISRERIGKELQTMFEGPAPWEALFHLLDSGLFSAAFSAPEPFTLQGAEVTQIAVTVQKVIPQLQSWQVSPGEETRMVMTTMLLLPLANQTFKDAKKKEHSVAAEIVSQSLKWRTKDADEVVLVHQHYNQWTSVLDWSTKGDPIIKDRKSTGLLLRRLGPLWNRALLLFLIQRVRLSGEKNAEVATIFDAVNTQLEELRLKGVWNLRPILNGDEVKKETRIERGPMVGKAMQALIEWQLEHPDDTEQEAREWLRSLKGF